MCLHPQSFLHCCRCTLWWGLKPISSKFRKVRCIFLYENTRVRRAMYELWKYRLKWRAFTNRGKVVEFKTAQRRSAMSYCGEVVGFRLLFSVLSTIQVCHSYSCGLQARGQLYHCFDILLEDGRNVWAIRCSLHCWWIQVGRSLHCEIHHVSVQSYYWLLLLPAHCSHFL